MTATFEKSHGYYTTETYVPAKRSRYLVQTVVRLRFSKRSEPFYVCKVLGARFDVDAREQIRGSFRRELEHDAHLCDSELCERESAKSSAYRTGARTVDSVRVSAVTKYVAY